MRIGVDLGGTKIEAIALDRDGRERGRRRVPTPARPLRARPWRRSPRWSRGSSAKAASPARVGIGMPGALSPATGLVKNANSVWLNGRPLRQDLERLLHRPLRFANDANCFALSEARDGAGAGARVVFGVILGTGTGGGIVVDGRALAGPERDRRRVGPQSAALARAPASGRGRPATAAGRDASRPSCRGPGSPGTTGRRRARRSTPRRSPRAPPRATSAARPTLARYEERLARALAAVVNLLDPDVIVLGGGLSNLARLYETVPAAAGAPGCSRTASTRRSARRATATRAASGERRGSGRPAEDDGTAAPWPPPAA